MAYLKRPQKGERVLQSLFDSVNSIIDYLPSITVRGDNYSTFVLHSTAGTVIHAKPAIDTDQNSGGKTYAAGSGLHLSGNIFSNALSGDGSTIAINNNIISCLVSPSGGGPDTNTTYIGELNADCQCGWIFVDDTPISGDTYVIRSNLRYLSQLYNYPLCTSISTPHFLVLGDLKDGAGTIVNYHRSSAGNHLDDDPDAPLITWIDGILVDISMSGGRFISPTFYKGVGYGDYSSAYIDCLLSGDNSHIFITDQAPNADGSYGGIISTNIHGDETTISMAADGTLSVIGGGGGGGGGDGCAWPKWENLAGSGNVVWTGVTYTTSTGGWLRISMRGTGGCYGVYIGGNYIGLGSGADTWPLAIPPGSTFLVDFPSGTSNDVMAWFDSNCSPAKVTTGLINYWRYGDQDTSEVMNDLDYSKSYLTGRVRSDYNYCKNNYTAMSGDWYNYLEHMDDPDFDPDQDGPADIWSYRSWRDNITGYNASIQEYGLSAIDYATSAINKNNSMGANKSDLMNSTANKYIDQASAYMTEAAVYQTSAIQICNYAEAYWQQHDPDYLPESSE